MTVHLNGYTVHANGHTKWVLLFFVLFVPAVILFNNLLFGVTYDGYQEINDDYIADWYMDDPRLIDHIRRHYLEPPAPRSLDYNLNNPRTRDFSHKRQSLIVADLLGDKPNGVFFEAGAYDGETYSNSLYFEKYRNWSGILVEPDFANLKRLRPKNRKATLVRSCLDGSTKPQKMPLIGAMDIGALEKNMPFSRKLLTRLWRPYHVTQVWCFPLYSILLACNQTKIDYMVIDVEGSEMDVLRSIPFDKVDVTVLQVEYAMFNGAHWHKDASQRRRDEMREFFRERLPQYEEASVVFLDLIYVKRNKQK